MLLLLAAAAVPADTGYEQVFEDALGEVDWQCQPAPLPAWLHGSFILPSVAQFSYGGKAFQGVLDGFGKLHRFQLAGGQVCTRAKMMRTDFYNKSRELGTVPPAALFLETVPPRTSCHLPLCNANGANDNTFVNTIDLGGEYSTWTDSPKATLIDPINLQVLGKYSWDDKVGTRVAHLAALGSAHPLRRPNGDLVALVTDAPMVDGAEHAYVDIVAIRDDEPHKRSVLYTTPKLETTPYFHSYGVTADYVVLPFTPMAFSMLPLVENKPMTQCFHSLPPQTKFAVIPFDGGDVVEFVSPDPFTYSHVVNSFQNDSGIVFDVSAFTDGALFLTQGASTLPVQRNKTLRDALNKDPAKPPQRTYRYVLHLSGDAQGQVTSEPLGMPMRATEYPKINNDYAGKEYCTYYATENFHNDAEYASHAIVKHNTCSGKRQWWYRPSSFNSEPFFVPAPGGGEEDGVLLFTSIRGERQSRAVLVIADAKTMDSIAEVPLPVPMTFTTHGEWFDGLVGTPGAAAAPVFI